MFVVAEVCFTTAGVCFKHLLLLITHAFGILGLSFYPKHLLAVK